MLAFETMNPEFYQQAQRLQDLWNAQLRRQQGTAYEYPSPEGDHVQESGSREWSSSGNAGGQQREDQQLRDPLIYPGVYAPSGFNIMDILVSVHTRPNPTISLGSIDHSVALTLCDSDAPDVPIVYCSEQFEALTGYSSSSIIGQNCRFLQNQPQTLSRQQPMDASDIRMNEIARCELKEKMGKGEEARVTFINFTKGGRRFVNILTVIPVSLEGKSYLVGFQADAGRAFV